MKLLLADDEVAVRSSLRNMVDWERYGYEVLEAENGFQAIERLRENAVDLLLLDITMPVMSGLDVLQWLKEQKYPCVTTLLTCHDEFCYAKKAIQYGCFDHVLKAGITADELFALVTRMRDELSEEKKRKQYLDELEIAARRKKRLEAQHLMNFWLTGDHLAEERTLSALADYAGYDETACRFSCLSLRMKDYHDVLKRYANHDIVEFSVLLDGMLRELFTRPNYFYTQPTEGFFFLIVWFDRGLSSSAVLRELQTFGERAEQHFRHALNIEITTLYSLPCFSVADTWVHYRKHVRVMELAAYDLLPPVACADDYVMDEGRELLFLQAAADALGQALDSRDLSRIRDVLTQLRSDMDAGKFCVSLALLADAIESQITRFLILHGQAGEKPFAPGDAPTYAVLQERLLTFLQPYCVVEQDQGKKSVVKRCILLIQQNYSDDIGLEWLAERLWVNPSYLSRIFSEEMKQTLTAYMQQYRIEKAKQLIRSNNLRLQEIAQRVGFSSAISFSTVFKKLTGQTPTEYRRQNV